MIRYTPRAGAIASAVLCLLVASGVGLSGATAQDQIAVPRVAASDAPPEPAPAEAGDQVRFYSAPVVQDVPAASAAVVRSPADRSQAGSLRELVAAVSSDEALSPELTCMAQAVYHEARGEALEGQLAVAQVIVNRAASGRFPADYCGVVTQRGQFSFVRGGVIPMPNQASAAWHRARAIARIAHQELWDSGVGDSLFFHASHVRPQWAARRASVARIDSHIFYK